MRNHHIKGGRDDEGESKIVTYKVHFEKFPTTSDAVLIETKNGIEVKLNYVKYNSGICQQVACVHHEHSILAIEQPELHIHPRIQQQIADMFITRRCCEPTIFLRNSTVNI